MYDMYHCNKRTTAIVNGSTISILIRGVGWNSQAIKKFVHVGCVVNHALLLSPACQVCLNAMCHNLIDCLHCMVRDVWYIGLDSYKARHTWG